MRLRFTVMIAVIAMLSSSCYLVLAVNAENSAGPVPWFCNPTNPNSVTGPGMGTVNWYAGITRAPLDYDSCIEVGAQFDLARAYAEQYPTLADAEAADFRPTFNRIPGMGTHHGLLALSPADINDPGFDRFNPVFDPASPIDDVFEPGRPEFLQYDSDTDPNAPLVGMSYYVRTDDGQPPEGFVGDNDWWHHHPWLCLSLSTAQVISLAVNEPTCGANQIAVYFGDYYMLHVWLVEDLELHNDVHSAFHPCIVAGGAIFDMDDDCHDGDSTVIPFGAARGASAKAALPEGASAEDLQPIFCPLGLLALPEST